MKAFPDFVPFEESRFLDDQESIALYLSLAEQDENPNVLLLALAEVAKARGMTAVAQEAKVNRTSLYKALTENNRTEHETIRRVLKALGMRFRIEAIGSGAADATAAE